MTTNTTGVVAPPGNAEMAAQSPFASELPTQSTVQPAPTEADLRARIATRRAELIAKIRELKSDVRLEAAEATGKARARLSELAHIVKWGIVDDWASVSAAVNHKLEQWLVSSALQPRANGQS